MSSSQPTDQGVIRYVGLVYNKFIFEYFLKKYFLHTETVPRSIEENIFF